MTCSGNSHSETRVARARIFKTPSQSSVSRLSNRVRTGLLWEVFCSRQNVSVMQPHFSDFIETGVSAQQTGLTIRLRRRDHQPSCSRPVERGAARVARHVRERLPKVILGYQPRAIFGFYLMRSARPRMRASGTRPALQSGGSVLFKAGAKRLGDASNPPAGLGPKPQGHSGERLDRFV